MEGSNGELVNGYLRSYNALWVKVSIERFFSFHFLVSQHHTSDVKSLGLVMLEEVKR